MKFELTNDQRLYFGLEPISPEWERVILKGDTYREESILYFDRDTIKRYIISTEKQYKESQYNDLTRSRSVLLPLTSKGKEKKLTASVLESRQPTGIYCSIYPSGRIFIGNYDTQTTFYDSYWEQLETLETKPIINELVVDFINTAPESYLSDIIAFKKAKRKHIKFKSGDFFSFKISRTEYGFGRILLDIDELKKKNLIHKSHGLNLIMTKPLLVKVYAYISKTKNVDINDLEKAPALPSDYMMDNLLYYGEFEIIGHSDLNENEFDFPLSYGRNLNPSKHSVFLQWGLINLELSNTTFNKYLVADNPFVPKESPSSKVINPYGYYSIGFRPKYSALDIKNAAGNNGLFDFDKHPAFKSNFDLRNPRNKEIRTEIMIAFGLDPLKSYKENFELTKTIKIKDLLKLIS